MDVTGSPAIHPRMMVEQMLDRHPRTAEVFIRRRMACVGCPVAAFETVEEAAIAYGQEPERFIEALRACVGEDAPGGGGRS